MAIPLGNNDQLGDAINNTSTSDRDTVTPALPIQLHLWEHRSLFWVQLLILWNLRLLAHGYWQA